MIDPFVAGTHGNPACRVLVGSTDLFLSVDLPASLWSMLRPYLQPLWISDSEDAVGKAAPHKLSIAQQSDGLFSIVQGSTTGLESGLTGGHVLAYVISTLNRLSLTSDNATVFDASAVGWETSSILLVYNGSFEPVDLIGWMMSKGFSYISAGQTRVEGLTPTRLPVPLPLREPIASTIPDIASIQTATGRLFAPPREWLPPHEPMPCRLVIFPVFEQDAKLSISKIDKGRYVDLLKPACRSPLTEASLREISDFELKIAAVEVRFGDFSDLDDVLDVLARLILDGELSRSAVNALLKAFDVTTNDRTAKQYPVQLATERKLAPRLTIGMTTNDDFDGVYFSIQAMRLYHPEILDQVEFLVIDQNPEGVCAEPLKSLDKPIPNYRYVPSTGAGETPGIETIFAEAAGEFVLCMDCHVFFEQGALASLLAYLSANANTPDLIEGLMLSESLDCFTSYREGHWQNGEFGSTQAPFEIPRQKPGVFVCRRDMWGTINPNLKGHTLDEGYLRETFRQSGGRTLCLPTLKWMRRTAQPMGQTPKELKP